MAKGPNTSLPGAGLKRWTHRSGLFFLFLGAGALLYLHGIREKNRMTGEMTVALHSLEKQKIEALKLRGDLLLQIQSQSDPAWVEMVLKRNLGMVREGQVKVYFHTND